MRVHALEQSGAGRGRPGAGRRPDPACAQRRVATEDLCIDHRFSRGRRNAGRGHRPRGEGGNRPRRRVHQPDRCLRVHPQERADRRLPRRGVRQRAPVRRAGRVPDGGAGAAQAVARRHRAGGGRLDARTQPAVRVRRSSVAAAAAAARFLTGVAAACRSPHSGSRP